MANEKKETINTVDEEVKVETKKSATNNDQKKIADLEAKIEEQSNQVNQLSEMVKMLTGLLANANTNKQEKNSLLDEVKIVHLVERDSGLSTHIELSNRKIDMHKFGEERTLDRREAEELCGRHRKFFELGIIAFGAGSEEFAKKFGLKSVTQYEYIESGFVERLGRLSPIELEDLYGKLCQGHKAFIIEYFKRKISENDPAFKNAQKIEVLNRLSDGAMSGVLLDMRVERERGN